MIIEESQEYVIAKQILKSGTSIGANIEEAIRTHYWLRLLRYSKIIEQQLLDSLSNDCNELIKFIGSIIKTLKNPNS